MDRGPRLWAHCCLRPVKFTVEKGVITKVEGGSEADSFRGVAERASMIPICSGWRTAGLGFGPMAKLTGDIVEDERVWGCTEWGFGNVGALLTSDIPEMESRAASHSDGICLNCSVWLDGVQVLDEGKVVGPTPEIVEMARVGLWANREEKR